MRFQAKHPQALFDDLGRSLFQELLTASGVGSDRFRAHYLPVAERLAMQIQELPLERETFAEHGGGLKFALLSALTTLRLCDSVVFAPSATAEVRMRVEPQYRFAAFCASLAAIPLIVHHHMTVTIEAKPWSLLSRTPLLWEALAPNQGYEVEWKPTTVAKPSAAMGFLVLSRFFDPGQWEEFDPDVVRGLCDAINPASMQLPAELALAKVVRVGHEKVRQAEQLRASKAFMPATASPTDAMVAVAIDATAQPNMTLAPVAPAPAPAEPSAPPAIPQEVAEWAAAVAHSQSALGKEITFLPDGKARVGVKALNFGAEAKAMYAKIFAAGLVHLKEERSVIVVERLAVLLKGA